MVTAPQRGVTGSGGQALTPACAAALQDRAAGARRHPRSKTMPPLSAANVWLIGPLHGYETARDTMSAEAPQYRRTAPHEFVHKDGRCCRQPENPRMRPCRRRCRRRQLTDSTGVESCVESSKMPAKWHLFHQSAVAFPGVVGLDDRCYARAQPAVEQQLSKEWGPEAWSIRCGTRLPVGFKPR
jgi:hypothetical protein